MSKNVKRYYSSILLLAFGIIISNLLGCATTDPNVKQVNKIDKVDKGQSSRFYEKESHINSDTSGNQITLPKITEDEHERLGDLKLNRREFPAAFIHYEKALLLNPDNTRVRYKKARLFSLTSRNTEAIKEFKKLLEKNPDYALAYEGIGQALFQMKKYEEAEKMFLRGLELDPKLWKAYNFLGVIYDYRKAHGTAINYYEKAASIKPNEGLIYNNLGVSYSMAGEYNKASAALQKALELNPENEKYYNNLGLVLVKLGKEFEALNAFRKAGDEARAYNNLGCIYMDQSDYEKAINCFEKAIELKSTFYEIANENLKAANLGRKRKLSLPSDVQHNFDAQTEQPAFRLTEKQAESEKVSLNNEAGLSVQETIKNDQKVAEEKFIESQKESTEGPISVSFKIDNPSQDDSSYAGIEDSSVELLKDGEGFRLKFKVTNPTQKVPIAGSVVIIAKRKNTHGPQFISFPSMELNEDGTPLKLKNALKFYSIHRFKYFTGEFNFSFSNSESFRILIYKNSGELVCDHTIYNLL